jgi:SAM-dependent methyltransferase
MKENLVQTHVAAFDGLADEYDSEFTATQLGSILRGMVWERYERCFAGREFLLEIGCGTGEDAVFLARRGHRVFATDASEKMVRFAQHKAARAGVADRIQFRCVPLEDLGAELAGMTFDGVYSNFGALNCAASLQTLAAELAPQLVAGAPLLWVLMGRHVPWEWAWFLARADARKAFRRWRREGVRWRGVTVSYPTPAALETLVHAHFIPRARRALGVALPPSYAAGWFNRSPKALSALTRVERVMQRWPGSASIADHYIFEAAKRPA